MEFLVLGPVGVVAGGQRAPTGGPKQRTVLALLVASAGSAVSFDRIIEATWGDEPPDGARATVHTYISNLRSVVGDVLERLGDGYVLRIDDNTIDANRFEQLYRRASEMLTDAPEEAAALLREALGLWRGHPYADIDARGTLEPEVTRLNELRVSTLLARIDADLALGHHAGLIGEIESLSAEHPLQEGFRARQMLALYRSGRQADALRVYDRTRRYLGDELGIDPSRELQHLEQRILDHDPSLDLELPAAIRHVALLVADVGDAETLARIDPGRRAGFLDEIETAVTSSVETAQGNLFAVRGSTQYASFENVADAIHAAHLTHRALDGSEGIPRIAVDAGDVETDPNGSLVGATVVRSAALVAAAHGGQVLVSSDAHDELTSSGADGWQVRALGSHRLHGIERARPVYQLLIEGREQTFPPLKVDAMPAALPGAGRGLFGYELRELVGEGTFGEVYRAYQPSVGREVAMKVLKPRFANEPEFVRRFEVEAQLVARLEHPHIVPLYDYWREPERAYLVMRWIRGGSLADRLANGPLDPDTTSRIVSQIAGALDAAHRHGVIHRDLKPSNVMLDDGGNAYLTDFGIAHSLTRSDEMTAVAAAYQPPEYLAPEERAGEHVSPAVDTYALGVLARHLITGGPTPDRDALLPDAVADVIDIATAPEPARRFGDAAALTGALRRALGTPTATEPTYTPVRNPYKGLAAFTEADAADFHGRDGIVDEILTAMGASRLVAVVGPSGIGKSSLVRAGVIPKLRTGAIDDSSEWFITDMIPGPYPFEELATALMRVASEALPNFENELQRDARGVVRTVKRLLPPDTELVIVVDQFEELFTLTDPETRDAFLDALTILVTEERSPARAVVTIRADYFDQPLRHAELGELLRSATVPVSAPTTDELHQIIEDPAAPLAVGYEPGLPDRIINEIADQPGALPLLEYTLTELFDNRQSDQITTTDYSTAGGVLGALGRRADEVFEELDTGGRQAARQVFLRLVSVDESLRPTRRRARRAELMRLAVPRRHLKAVLAAYGQTRHLTFDRDSATRGPTVEVAHEALFTEWARFAGWIEGQREHLLMSKRLAVAVQDWETADRDDTYLLSGGALAQHEAWTADTDLVLTNAEQNFLAKSRTRENHLLWRRRRRRIGVTAGFGVAAALASLLAVFAASARSTAVQEERVATARGLAAAAANHVAADPERSLLLAIAAADITRREGEPVVKEAVEELHRSLTEHRVLARYPGGGGVAVSPDGSLMAVGGDGPGVVILDPTTGDRIHAIAEDVGGCCNDLGFAPDNRTLWIANEGGLSVWDAAAGQRLAAFGKEVWDVSGLGPDGSPILVAGPDGYVLWDWRSDGELASRPDLADREALSPDGRLIALAWEVNAIIYDSSLEFIQRQETPLPDGEARAIEFSPDSTKLALLTARHIVISDVASGVVLVNEGVELDENVSVVWSPAGDRLAVKGATGDVAIIDAFTGEQLQRLAGTDEEGTRPAWFPDGTRLAVAGRTTETIVWDTSESTPIQGIADGDDPRAIRFGAAWILDDSSEIALEDDGVRVYAMNAVTGTAGLGAARDHIFSSESAWFEDFGPRTDEGLPRVGAAVSANDEIIAVGGDTGITFFDGRSRERLGTIRSHWGVLLGDAFSPDGSAVAAANYWFTGDNDRDIGTQGVFDVSSGEVRFNFGDLRDAFSAEFHPSGEYVVVLGRGPAPLRMYDTRSGEPVFTAPHESSALSISPDGSQLALVDFAGNGYLYDMILATSGATSQEALIHSWQALDWEGRVVKWTPDGSRLFFAGLGDRTIVYDGAGRRTLLRLHTGRVSFIDFSDDGELVLLSGEHGPRIIALDTEDLLAAARSRLTRGFTDSECVEFFPDGDCPTFEELKAG